MEGGDFARLAGELFVGDEGGDGAAEGGVNGARAARGGSNAVEEVDDDGVGGELGDVAGFDSEGDHLGLLLGCWGKDTACVEALRAPSLRSSGESRGEGWSCGLSINVAPSGTIWPHLLVFPAPPRGRYGAVPGRFGRGWGNDGAGMGPPPWGLGSARRRAAPSGNHGRERRSDHAMGRCRAISPARAGGCGRRPLPSLRSTLPTPVGRVGCALRALKPPAPSGAAPHEIPAFAGMTECALSRASPLPALPRLRGRGRRAARSPLCPSGMWRFLPARECALSDALSPALPRLRGRGPDAPCGRAALSALRASPPEGENRGRDSCLRRNDGVRAAGARQALSPALPRLRGRGRRRARGTQPYAALRDLRGRMGGEIPAYAGMTECALSPSPLRAAPHTCGGLPQGRGSGDSCLRGNEGCALRGRGRARCGRQTLSALRASPPEGESRGRDSCLRGDGPPR